MFGQSYRQRYNYYLAPVRFFGKNVLTTTTTTTEVWSLGETGFDESATLRKSSKGGSLEFTAFLGMDLAPLAALAPQLCTYFFLFGSLPKLLSTSYLPPRPTSTSAWTELVESRLCSKILLPNLRNYRFWCQIENISRTHIKYRPIVAKNISLGCLRVTFFINFRCLIQLLLKYLKIETRISASEQMHNTTVKYRLKNFHAKIPSFPPDV